MNKKVLTLCAGFLLAGSLTAVAQYCPTNGEVPYRTHQVKAATLDETFSDVKKINENYYYQLQVNPNSLKGVNAKEDGNYVLTVERDYSTGKLYLTAQKITDATLTHSLWQIKANGREVNGRLYSFVNKETGYELTFDHYNAIQMNGSDDVVFPTSLTTDEDKKFANNYEWTYENKGILSGCNEWWSLYTTEDNGKTALPLVYADGTPLDTTIPANTIIMLVYDDKRKVWVYCNPLTDDVQSIINQILASRLNNVAITPAISSYLYTVAQEGVSTIVVTGFNKNTDILYVNYGQTMLRQGIDYVFTDTSDNTIMIANGIQLAVGDQLFFQIVKFNATITS